MNNMVALARNFSLFVGKSFENVDLHVQQFVHYWKVAKPRDPAITKAKMNELKNYAFINTFKKKAIKGIQGTNWNTSAYASKMMCIRQSVEDTMKPSINKLVEWFINGL